jgi:predicted PurR-regulated permease PerM
MGKRSNVLLAILGSLILIIAVWYFKTVVFYILISAIVSIIGQPISKQISRIKIRSKEIPSGVIAITTLFAMWSILLVFFLVFIPYVMSGLNILTSINAELIYNHLEKIFNNLFSYFQSLGFFDSYESFKDYLISKLVLLFNTLHVADMFSDVTSMLGNIIIASFSISFITFFFLKDTKMFSNSVLLLIPENHTHEVRHILISIKKLLSKYIIGVFLEVIMVMILVTFGLWLVGVEFQNAIICGIASGILNIIPYVGPWIGAIFGILIGVVTNSELSFQTELLPLLGFMLLVYLTVQLIDNIIFQPLIYSSSVNSHPLEIFIVILLAGSGAGIVGMVLAIPIYTVLKVIAKEFFSNIKLIKKITKNI